MKRREFLNITGTTAVCTCIGFAGINGCSMIRGVSDIPPAPPNSFIKKGNKVAVDVLKIDSIKEVGSAVKFSIKESEESEIKIVIVHMEENLYKAFSDNCTHGERELNYLHNEKKFQCSSFGHSQFDLNGKVLEGPAEKPILEYLIKNINDTIIIDV